MIRARKVYWFAQIGGWALLSVMLFISNLSLETVHFDKKPDFSQLGTSTVTFFVLGVILTHAMRSLYISFGWLNIKLTPLLPRIIGLSIVFAAIMTLFTHFVSIILYAKVSSFSLVEYSLDVFATTLFFTLWNGVYFTFHFFQRSKEQEVNNLQLTASHNEIELKNLRSQLNPHFLFNSLNSIRALIDIEPNQAKTNVTKLSNLLRKSLVIGKEQLVTLSEELSIVQDYMDLEKVRFEERVTVIQEHDESLSEILIPPFIIQTLVENAFKHGIGKRINGGIIWIKSFAEKDTVTICVINEGELQKETNSGIGIENTKRRLELQYKGSASFKLYQEDEKVIAKIELKNTVI